MAQSVSKQFFFLVFYELFHPLNLGYHYPSSYVIGSEYFFQKREGTMLEFLPNPTCSTAWNSIHMTQMVIQSVFMETMQAYPLRVRRQVPFRRNGLTPAMEAYNFWSGHLKMLLSHLKDFKRSLKVGLSSVGKMYFACAQIQKAITCLYGNHTSQFFNLDPPALQDYFQ